MRLTELYHAYEEYNEELAMLDSSDAYVEEFENLQDRFYNLTSKIEDMFNATGTSSANSSVSHDETRVNNDESVTRKRRIKLPEASLPTFDGRFEGWLSFKNAFQNMISSHSDLSDVDKLHYLKSALTGDAARKINIFTVDKINYDKAWDLLERSYEVRRILIDRHISSILNLPPQERETTSGFSKLAQQHVAALNALGISITPEVVVHVLRSKLPKATLEKWEATLEMNECPGLDQMYDFLYKTAVCASMRERTLELEKCKGEPPAKKKRFQPENKAFVSNIGRKENNCIVCKSKRHPLYLCDKFKQLPIPKHIETVKGAKPCQNCMRSHRDRPYKFSSCSICQKRHNTLLHIEGYAGKSNLKNDVD
ncbi:uncharacterized protein LOC105193065 [Solenopsis invicta]|uniref:uncharacterized protein LOC105193065 n=1 Tax=Solenopsis invicta TaxID=13686 RepID=UPI0005961354|nr:uncharacterized protein LOC105193065 [Solenopsis invicta]